MRSGRRTYQRWQRLLASLGRATPGHHRRRRQHTITVANVRHREPIICSCTSGRPLADHPQSSRSSVSSLSSVGTSFGCWNHERQGHMPTSDSRHLVESCSSEWHKSQRSVPPPTDITLLTSPRRGVWFSSNTSDSSGYNVANGLRSAETHLLLLGRDSAAADRLLAAQLLRLVAHDAAAHVLVQLDRGHLQQVVEHGRLFVLLSNVSRAPAVRFPAVVIRQTLP